MFIKEVEIDNFKSFANKVNIPFLEGFTTISGPNGSGKSNIIDSVLFALGLSSSRTLRAEKISQLISTHTRRNEAFVLCFQLSPVLRKPVLFVCQNQRLPQFHQ